MWMCHVWSAHPHTETHVLRKLGPQKVKKWFCYLHIWCGRSLFLYDHIDDDVGKLTCHVIEKITCHVIEKIKTLPSNRKGWRHLPSFDERNHYRVSWHRHSPWENSLLPCVLFRRPAKKKHGKKNSLPCTFFGTYDKPLSLPCVILSRTTNYFFQRSLTQLASRGETIFFLLSCVFEKNAQQRGVFVMLFYFGAWQSFFSIYMSPKSQI
jgi:hypothetical protein